MSDKKNLDEFDLLDRQRAASDEEDEKGCDTDRDNWRAPLADLRPCHRRDFMSITRRPFVAGYSADALLASAYCRWTPTGLDFHTDGPELEKIQKNI